MAAAALPLLAIGTAISAIGAISSANSQAAAMQSQAAASRYNAQVSRDQAEQALDVSTSRQLQLRRDARQNAGRQRAAAAQSGVGFGGSTADVMEKTETLSELDVLNVAYEGALRSQGYSTQAQLDEFNAAAYDRQAKAAKRAGWLNAAGTVAMGGYMASGAFGSPAAKTTVAGGTGLRPGTSGMGFRPYGGTGLRL